MRDGLEASFKAESIAHKMRSYKAELGVVGAVLAYLIALFAGWHVVWAALPIIVSVLLCTVIGLGFSVYPARQAAALDPIEAIRAE